MASRLLGTLALAASFAAPAAELEGVKLDDRVKSGAQELQLNGIGLRTRLVFRVYVAGLYLAEKTQSAESALAMKGPKRIVLVLLRDLGSGQLGDALVAGLKDNVSPQELARLQPQVDELLQRMAQIGEAKKGAVIELDHAGGGTALRLNGAPQGAPIGDEAFFNALLRVWLGERPVQDDLKNALLGRPA